MNIEDIAVPLDVNKNVQAEYRKNYYDITRGSGNIMLFAGDQKVEHLNKDFYGEGIHPDDNHPIHFFNVASEANIGVFATQLGLLAQFGADYKDVPFLVKLNSKSNLVKTEQMDPFSNQLIDVDQVVEFKENSGLNILGVGYTIYLGSEYESQMLRQAAQAVYQAHYHGLVTVLWIYPRGKAVPNEKDARLIAGACGVAACLNSDFVKVNPPKAESDEESAELMKEAVAAAGRTKVICAGGSSTDPKAFLQRLYNQIHVAGAAGNATGRNIHQKGLDEAVRMCNAISSITLDGADVETAYKIYTGEK